MRSFFPGTHLQTGYLLPTSEEGLSHFALSILHVYSYPSHTQLPAVNQAHLVFLLSFTPIYTLHSLPFIHFIHSHLLCLKVPLPLWIPFLSVCPLDCKETQPVHSEGDQPWDFFGRNDAKVGTPVFWPPHAKSWLIGKDSDAGRDWGQEEKGMTEDERAGWHHWLDGHESEWTPGVGDGQGGLACCDSRGRKESDMTERLNWTELNWPIL